MIDVTEIAKQWAPPWVIAITIIYLVLKNPEKAERIAGWFLGFFSWAGKGIRHRSIKFKLEGQVNSFARTIDKEAKGSMPYNMRLNFVKEVDSSELDPEKQLVIVRINDRGGEDRNLVHAMVTFCPTGVIPQVRPYLSKAMNEGINITVTRKLLNYLKHFSAIQYLYDEVLPECIKEIPELEEMSQIFDVMDERGLFTRVFLEEIRDFGARIQTRYPGESHATEATTFIKYVHEVATMPPGKKLLDIGHYGQYIATAFMFVGTGETMFYGGAATYLDHIRKLREHGFEKAYLSARGGTKKQTKREKSLSKSIEMAKRVSYLAERANLAKIGRNMPYYAATQQGENRLHILIELDLTS